MGKKTMIGKILEAYVAGIKDKKPVNICVLQDIGGGIYRIELQGVGQVVIPSNRFMEMITKLKLFGGFQIVEDIEKVLRFFVQMQQDEEKIVFVETDWTPKA